MPNHIKTIIRTQNQTALKKLAYMADVIPKENTYDHTFDFNVFIKMSEHSDTFFAEGGLGNEEKSKYGKNNWYDWSVKNWGTKWNAYEVEINLESEHDPEFDNYISFQTAWSHPTPIIEAISKKFPSEVFWIQYADEDIGNNLGEYWIHNGRIIKEVNFLKSSREACMFARAVRY